MGGLFKHKKSGGQKPAPAPLPAAAPPPQMSGAAIGNTVQNTGATNQLSNQATISRGTFLGS